MIDAACSDAKDAVAVHVRKYDHRDQGGRPSVVLGFLLSVLNCVSLIYC